MKSLTSTLRDWLLEKPIGYQFDGDGVTAQTGIKRASVAATVHRFLEGRYLSMEDVGKAANNRPSYRYTLIKSPKDMRVFKTREPNSTYSRRVSLDPNRTESYAYTLVKALATKPVGWQFSADEAAVLSGLRREQIVGNLRTPISKGYVLRRNLGKSDEWPHFPIYDYRIERDFNELLRTMSSKPRLQRHLLPPAPTPTPAPASVSQPGPIPAAVVSEGTAKLQTLSDVADRLVDLAAVIQNLAKDGKALKDYSTKDLLSELTRRSE